MACRDSLASGYSDQRELVHGPNNISGTRAIPRNVPSGSWIG